MVDMQFGQGWSVALYALPAVISPVYHVTTTLFIQRTLSRFQEKVLCCRTLFSLIPG